MKTLAMTALIVAAAALRASSEESKGALPDVLIQAEQKKPVLREKPPIKADVKEDWPVEPFIQETEDEIKSKIPSEIAQSTAFVPGVSNSPQVAVPSSAWILSPWRGAAARTFYPMAELLKVYPAASKEDRSKGHWELVVVDSGGKGFRRFGGQGAPPEKLEFDGKSDEGAWLRAGQAYTGVLAFSDSSGRAHTSMGKPFAVAGINLQDAQGAVITLAPRLLFSKDSPAQLSPQGLRLLGEAAQLIQRHYPGMGLEIAARLSRSDSDGVQAAGDAAAKSLAKSLLMAPSAVAVKGYPGTSDLEERIDVRILNR